MLKKPTPKYQSLFKEIQYSMMKEFTSTVLINGLKFLNLKSEVKKFPSNSKLYGLISIVGAESSILVMVQMMTIFFLPTLLHPKL